MSEDTSEKKHAGGRPTKYKPEYCLAVEALARLGWTEDRMADKIGVALSTFALWKTNYKEFSDALKAGKEEPDQAVERSLFERATGYVNKNAVKIFMPANAEEPVYAPYEEHVAPDVTAQIFWLKNRRPDRWRDRMEYTGKDGEDLFKAFSDAKDSKLQKDSGLVEPEL